ncbi:hypothetical protein [Enterococcus rotai]|uniref:hypothetical protein n=1 Tax=Enterococcus rotai TaxID=118060 RepID=UPI0035C6902C
MKKVVFSLIASLFLFIPQSVLATEKESTNNTFTNSEVFEVEINDSNTTTPAIASSITSRALLSYFKTVTQSNNINSFSSTIYYSEYSNYHKHWYRGTLTLRSIKRVNGRYVATYSGPLVIIL